MLQQPRQASNPKNRIRVEDMLLTIDLIKEVGIDWFQLQKAWKLHEATPFDRFAELQRSVIKYTVQYIYRNIAQGSNKNTAGKNVWMIVHRELQQMCMCSVQSVGPIYTFPASL